MYDIFYVSKEAVSQSRWSEFKKRFPRSQKIENADIEFLKKKSLTKFFWVVWDDVIIEDNFNLDYRVSVYDENYIHVFKNGKFYDGICLISKYHQVAKKEFDNRFFTDKKEIDILASNPVPYDVFHLITYEDYLSAIEKSSASMFWGIWNDIEVLEDFDFNYQVLKQDQHITHIFKNGRYYDGVCLFSKYVSVGKKEFNYRFFSNKKEVDILASRPKVYDKFNISNYDEYVSALDKSSTEMFWAIWNDIELTNDFNFDYQVPRYNQHITHIFKNKDFFDGLCLMSKNKPITKKELEHRFFIEKKEIDVVASIPKMYNIFYISSYEEYMYALNESSTDLFWMTSYNLTPYTDYSLYFPHYDEGNRKENHVFGHKVNGEILYNGIILCSKFKELSKKEIEYRFPINRIEHDEIYSGPVQYEKFVISDYDSFCTAFMLSKTEMFWMIPNEVEVINDFNFDLYFTHDNKFDRSIHHSFKHLQSGEETYNGINLISKQKMPSKKEIDFRFIIERKEHDVVTSKLRPYDIVFISYDEVNADENYAKLLEKFPRAKRVHKVKGIHNAHIEAAKLCDTDMFWVVDADAIIEDNFNFDYEVSRYDLDTVFVWQSKNPINDLVYGYGGVKLLPRDLTVGMKTDSVDMTMSISKKFKSIDCVSNVTAFNYDEFSAWKSAFRECVKLASSIVNSDYDDDTDRRLDIWCSVGEDRHLGKFALAGAKMGRDFGFEHIDDRATLSKINDFEWLKDTYEKYLLAQGI